MRIDILSDAVLKDADAICFTSNGVVKANGDLVMGAGVAKQFRDKFPGLAKMIGARRRVLGQHVHFWAGKANGYNRPDLVSFPTKNDWRDPSDIQLIKQSAEELMHMADVRKWQKVYLPRPGIGLGGLSWDKVKMELEKILDDRVIITYL